MTRLHTIHPPAVYLHILLAVVTPLALLTTTLFIPRSSTPLHRAVYTLNADANTLRLAHEAGFDTVVQLFSWRQIEPTQGEYHWQYPDEVVQGAAYYGLNLVIRIDQQPQWAADAPLSVNAPPKNTADYAHFVRTVAARYQGRVLGYIIWNEPNLSSDWGGQRPDPAGYVALLKAGYQAVKVADPGALVISAGLASTDDHTATALDDRAYLEAMYQDGAGPYFDILGAHPYGFAYPPDDPRGAHQSLNMARLSDLRDIMVSHGDGNKPIWATEMGWTTAETGPAAWQAVSEQQQADYLTRAFTQAGRSWPWLGMLAVWNLDDAPDTQWAGYNLLDAQGQPRAAYRALQQLFRQSPAASLADQVAALGRSPAPAAGGESDQVLAADTIIHLGHRNYSAPWVPLYGAHSPSTSWRGTVYVRDPNGAHWNLTVRLMQSNAAGNFIWINGHRLDPAFPPEDYSNSWVTYTWSVPDGMLQAGPNQVQITIGEALPLLQDGPFNWDDLQFKDIVLWHGSSLAN
jgi:hypothetical protein